jgi:hypothetical protein
MSVAECQRQVSSREFAEWMALYRIEAEERDPTPKPKYQLRR